MTTLFTLLFISAVSGIKDLLATLPPKLYLSTSLTRLLTQLIFFALLGKFLGGKALLLYALVGNAVASIAMLTMVTVAQDLSDALRAGTMAQLVATPTNPLWPITAWGGGRLLLGFANSLIGIYILAPILGLRFGAYALWAIPVLVLIGITTYGLGLALVAITLRLRGSMLISNGFLLLLYSLTGVNFPIEALPGWLQQIGWSLPISHGLFAIRTLITDSDISHATLWIVQEIGIGAIYLFLGLILFHLQIEASRRNGNLDFYS